jgi:hypothetical protein
MTGTPERPGKRRARSRANGEGSIYKRASDGLWVGTAYLPNGKRRPVYGKTRGAVVQKKRDLETEIEQGLPITSGRGITLGQYLERQWLAVTLPQRVAAGRLAETTLDSYRDNAEKHIIPALGGEKLSKLGPTRIRQWLTELQAKPSGRVRRVLREGEMELPRRQCCRPAPWRTSTRSCARLLTMQYAMRSSSGTLPLSWSRPS